MFIVESYSPLDDRWEERDREIFAAAGRRPDLPPERSSGGECTYLWREPNFDTAHRLRKALEAVEGVTASLREARGRSRVRG